MLSIQGVSQRPPPPRSSPDLFFFLLKLQSTLLVFAKRGRRCGCSLPSVFPSFILDFYSLFVHSSTHLSINLSIPSTHLSIHPPLHLRYHPAIHPPTHLSMHSSVSHLPVQPSSIRHPLSIHPCILPSIHPQTTEGLSPHAAL